MWAFHTALKEFVVSNDFMDGSKVVYRAGTDFKGPVLCGYQITNFELPNTWSGQIREPILSISVILAINDASEHKHDEVLFKWLSLDYLVRLQEFLSRGKLLVEEKYTGTDQTFEEDTEFRTEGAFKVRGTNLWNQRRVDMKDLRDLARVI